VLVHECLYVPAVDRLVLKTRNGATLKKHLLESHTSTKTSAASPLPPA